MNHRIDLDRHGALNPKPRKMSTGGNRSWSEEEEAYLLQTRMQKMPYKHIAAHLKKTELACRLHYHQLSHGSHRRRRASTSTSSSSSSSSSKYSISQLPLPGTFDPTGGLQSHPHGSPNGYHTLGNTGYPGLPSSTGRVQHKVLLPKPPTITPDSSPDRLHGLRIDTANPGMQSQSSVDADRLHAIYNSHRSNFWSAIAAEYGSDLSAGQLEDVWRHNTNVLRRPPTPGDSPNSRSAHSLLKPSPFPYQTQLEPPKDYSPVGHVLGAISPPDHRLTYQMGTVSAGSYDTLPSLPPLDRHSWSQQQVPATAITALLTEDKCPRHNEYCPPGRCFANH